MDPVHNPYAPGAGTQPPALIGRDDLLAQFDVLLARTARGAPAKSLIPNGLRGVGKTVLLNRFVDKAQDFGAKVAYIEAPQTGTLRMMLTTRLRQLLMELDRIGGMSAKVRESMRVLQSFTVSVNSSGIPSLEFGLREPGLADSGVLANDLTDLLVSVGRAADDRGSLVMIAIDEVQNLTEEEFSAIITAIHRTTQLGLPILFVGTGLPQVMALAGSAKSYAERLFDFPPVGSLSELDAKAAVKKPAQEKAVVFTEQALDEMFMVTKGYPYFVQEWAYEAWNYAERSPIALSDIVHIRQVVQDKLDRGFFAVRFDRLAPSEKKYLRAMAGLGHGPHRSSDIASRYGTRVAACAPIRSQLIKKGMIYSPSHGDTAFTVPLFDEFMCRAIPSELEGHPRSEIR
jgi:hypothetical protein